MVAVFAQGLQLLGLSPHGWHLALRWHSCSGNRLPVALRAWGHQARVPSLQLCVCHWAPTTPVDSGTSGFPYGWCLACVFLVVLLLVSNAALVCKVSWKDSSSGADKEFQINVKGKSKGVYGAGRGLAITG